MKGRRSLLLMLFGATLATACSRQVPDSEPATKAIPTYSASEFFETTSYGLVPAGGKAFSHDGRFILMNSDESGVFNAYTLPVSGEEPVQLTDSTDNAVFGESWFPEDNRILYTYDSGGNELNHVVVRELDGSYRDLTPGEDLKAGFLDWSDDGRSFYLVTTERNQRSFDVYRYSTADYERELVFENPGLSVGSISRDGRWLALDKPRTSADSDVYVVDLESDDKEAVLITEHEDNIAYGALGFTPDSRFLNYSTNEFGEFNQVWQYNLQSGEKSMLAKADWDVWYVSDSPGGRYRVTGVNADARTQVTLSDLATGKDFELPGLPPGDLNSIRFFPDDSMVTLIVNADNSPSNIHLVDLVTGTSRQLTNALNPAIDPAHLVRSTVIRYESFDGLEIPGILYKPHNTSPANPAPALVWVHGGPGGQSRKGYSATIQHLVNHGYAVLAANNRGSSGYGKTFYHLDDRRHGEEDLQDIVYARRYLETLDWIDGESVGVIGGSYGGYMVAAALAFEPEVFDVGINIFGVTNWVRTLESIPPWWEDFKESLYDEMGDPAIDAERHRRISPLFHAENIVKPLLVVQGANDPRVLQVESDELVAAVQANEVPVQYVVFPDEGHGFRKRENRIAASEAYLEFLDTYLRSEN
ncbi:MAG: S9 family peptidase [Gammaproteobacteria bacterium]|nr:S9 family peptidase [Gammaproteobacteria bacterium]MDH3480082.1 S9 family peptidase [Gammaproteobacteria bacterium]